MKITERLSPAEALADIDRHADQRRAALVAPPGSLSAGDCEAIADSYDAEAETWNRLDCGAIDDPAVRGLLVYASVDARAWAVEQALGWSKFAANRAASRTTAGRPVTA